MELAHKGPQRDKIAILGGGLSGLSVARMLHDKGREVVVFEKEKTIGGLCRSRSTTRGIVDTGGGHIFNTNDPKVRDWVFSVYPKEKWYFSQRKAKVWMDEKYYDYPIEQSFDIQTTFSGEPRNYKEWLLSKFGEELCEKYFFPYNRKVWRYPLWKMSFDWCASRMPVDDKDIVHSEFYYPKQGGIQAFIEAIAKPILGSIFCSTNLTIWQILGKYKTCIITAPLPEILQGAGIPDGVRALVGSLRWNGHTAVYLLEPSEDEETTWIYYPSLTDQQYKKSYTGKFDGSMRNDLVCYEFIGRGGPMFEKYSYPIQTLDLAGHLPVSLIKMWTDSMGIILLGRFAEWKYYTMDDCIQRAMEVADGMD